MLAIVGITTAGLILVSMRRVPTTEDFERRHANSVAALDELIAEFDRVNWRRSLIEDIAEEYGRRLQKDGVLESNVKLEHSTFGIYDSNLADKRSYLEMPLREGRGLSVGYSNGSSSRMPILEYRKTIKSKVKGDVEVNIIVRR